MMTARIARMIRELHCEPATVFFVLLLGGPAPIVPTVSSSIEPGPLEPGEHEVSLSR